MNDALVCLGSASPRRAELLAQLGLPFVVKTVDIDESVRVDEGPLEYVERLALDKAAAIACLMDESQRLPVLTADTAVVVGSEILGKPRDRSHGLSMMEQLSGRTHQVYTAIAVCGAGPESRYATCVSVSEVSFRVTSMQERQAYWATGEPTDKAGGYGIQGYAAAFISHLSGSFSGVMGLPLFETAELLRDFGVEVCDSWGSL